MQTSSKLIVFDLGSVLKKYISNNFKILEFFDHLSYYNTETWLKPG